MLHRATFAELRALTLTNFAIAGFTYVVSIILARAIGPEEFGVYSFALVAGTLLSQLILFGTSEIAVKFVAHHGVSALDSIATVKLLNFIVVATLSFIFLWFYPQPHVIFSLIVATSALSFSTHYESCRQNTKYAFIFLFERSAISIAILVVALFFDSNQLLIIFIFILVAQLLSIVKQIIDHKPSLNFKNFNILIKIYNDGLFLLIFNLSKFGFGGATRIIIFNELGDARLGVFSAAWQFVPMSTIYFSQVTKTWRLKITEAIQNGDKLATIQHIKELTLTIFIPSFAMSIVFIFWGHNIMYILFTPDFYDAANIMPYIGVYFIIIGMDSALLMVSIALNLLKATCLIYGISSIITILMCLNLSEPSMEMYAIILIAGHLLAMVTLSTITFTSLRRALT